MTSKLPQGLSAIVDIISVVEQSINPPPTKDNTMTLPVALYTTTIGPTGQHIADGWLPAGTTIEDIDTSINASDITVTLKVGAGLAAEQIRMSPTQLATFAGEMAQECNTIADYLQHIAEKAAEEMGW